MLSNVGRDTVRRNKAAINNAERYSRPEMISFRVQICSERFSLSFASHRGFIYQIISGDWERHYACSITELWLHNLAVWLGGDV